MPTFDSTKTRLPTLSKYRLAERSDGFTVEAPDRVPVRVTLADTGFQVEANLPRQLRLFPGLHFDEEQALPNCTLIQYRRLVGLVCGMLMSEWKRPKGGTNLWAMQKWAVGKTMQALGGRIHEQWRRLTPKADAEILAVQKAVFAVAPYDDPILLYLPELYRDRYLVSDILRYRAAAAVVLVAPDLVEKSERRRRQTGDHPIMNEPHGSAREWAARIVPRMTEWHGLYSESGEPYRCLTRTLMQLPGGLPSDLLRYLPDVRLTRPITDRVELATLLLLMLDTEDRGEPDAANPRRVRLFQRATRAEIRGSLDTLSRELNAPLSHRRSKDLHTLVTYVQDFPDDCRGRLPSRVRQAVRWHRTMGLRHPEPSSGVQTEASRLTAVPPIPLPQQPEVRFLRDVDDVLGEGERMRHCVGLYAERAVAGGCYLFHIDYAGEEATVEVGASGRVRQAFGPDNQPNQAARFGTQLLQRWGRKIASGPESPEQSAPD